MMAVIVDTFEGLGAKVTRREIPLPEIDAPTYDFRPYPVGVLSTQKPEVIPPMQTPDIKREVEAIFARHGLTENLRGDLPSRPRSPANPSAR